MLRDRDWQRLLNCCSLTNTGCCEVALFYVVFVRNLSQRLLANLGDVVVASIVKVITRANSSGGFNNSLLLISDRCCCRLVRQ